MWPTMGDRSWLGFGVRARTPQPSQQPAHPDNNDDDDRNATTSAENPTTERTLQRAHTEVPLQKNPHKAPRLSRFSSLMGLSGAAKALSPVTTSFEIAPNYPEMIHQRGDAMKTRTVTYHDAVNDPSTGIWSLENDPNSEFRFRESDMTWHNPNLQQMMETVLSAIMTNGISAPIPTHLNAFVAGMIEEYAVHLGHTKALQRKFNELTKTRSKEVQELRETTTEWQEREKQFKLEIKRLERIISDTQEGAESVVLARAGSVCNRNDGRAFRAKLNRLSRSDEDEDEVYYTPPQHCPAPILRDAPLQPQSEAISSHDFAIIANPSYPSASASSNLTKQMTGVIHPPAVTVTQNAPRIGSEDVERPVAGPSKPNRNSDSTASTNSGTASSRSSGLVMGRGVQGGAAPRSHITPGTTPPHIPLAAANKGKNTMMTLRELVTANGGMPEDAIADDSSSYAASAGASRDIRAYSFGAGDDATRNNDDALVQEPAPQAATENARRSSNVVNRSPGKTAKERSSLPTRPAAGLSPTLRFMGRNHVGRTNSSPGDGRGVFIPGWSSPTRKAESGSEPFPSQETIQIARQLRTVVNTHGNSRAYLSDEELADVRTASRARVPLRPVPTRAQTDAPTHAVLSTNVRDDQGAVAPEAHMDQKNQQRASEA